MDRRFRIGVVGGGTMGGGIAHAFASAGDDVVVIEADDTRVERAAASIEAALRRAAARGHVDDADAAIARVTVTTNPTALAGVHLAVEAVPEDAALKRSVLQGMAAAVADEAVIATNTSSISVDELADVVSRPERFLGMHFFNPVPASLLVELVRGTATERGALDVARVAAERIGKETIEVSDSPGFASSRLGVAIGLEAIRMLEEGVATADDIDDAMVLGYRFPMGPLHLTDLVGLDVRLAIAEYLHERLGDRFAPPSLLREKVAHGELGKKTGRGFFDWSEP